MDNQGSHLTYKIHILLSLRPCKALIGTHAHVHKHKQMHMHIPFHIIDLSVYVCKRFNYAACERVWNTKLSGATRKR